MDTETPNSLITSIQLSVSPVILTSGVGLLLLSMTNRFGRLIDRTRLISRELRTCSTAERPMLEEQLGILFRRAMVMRVAIVLAIACILGVSLLIFAIFMTGSLGPRWTRVVISSLFVGSIGALTISVLALLKEILLSLEALKLEIKAAHPPKPGKETGAV